VGPHRCRPPYVRSMLLVFAITAAIGAGLVSICLLVDRILAAPRSQGAKTAHFDGQKFHNVDGARRKGLLDFLRWRLTSRPGKWNKWTDIQRGSKPPTQVTGAALRVTFVNHASVLIQIGGLNILTDPIWSARASPVTWAGPKRHRPPGIRFEDLPPIDVVLISHNHYDHLDINTLVRLQAEHGPRFVTALGNRALLNKWKIFEVTELDWWSMAPLSTGVNVNCVPAKHFSGRALSDSDATLWCGYVIQTSAGNIYFAGDTGLGRHFAEIKDRFGSFRLALLPIGAYLPNWFMHPVHLSPGEAVDVHHALGSRVSMAIHFGTFALGDDGEFEPLVELRQALADKTTSTAEFWILEPGEGRNVPEPAITSTP